METREEIESMRVSDLREFLSRHGQSLSDVSRLDGTPGQPRKADLLAAALQLHQSLTTTQDSPIRQRRRSSISAKTPTTPNPFQSGVTSPPIKTRPTMQEETLNTPQPNQQSQPRPQSQQKQGRSRRSSNAWVDPKLLNKMLASASPAPKESLEQDTETTDVITPRPASASTTIKPSTLNRPRRPSRASLGASIPSSSTDKPIIRGEPRRSEAAAAAGAAASARFAQTRIRQFDKQNDDEVQFVAQTSKKMQQSPMVQKTTITNMTNEGYASEEDEDYEYEGDREDFDEDDDEVDDIEVQQPQRLSVKRTDGAGPSTRTNYEYDDDVIEIEKVPNRSSARSTQQHQRQQGYDDDVIIDSDYDHRGASTSGSDTDKSSHGSDIQITGNVFYSWSRPQLKEWLQKNKVIFNPNASRVDLISIARGHWMYLETRDHATDGDTPSTGNKVRRRRIISAPNGLDEDDNGEQEAGTSVPQSYGRRYQNRGPVWLPAQRIPGRGISFVFIGFNVLLLFLIVVLAIITVHEGYMKEYCDSVDIEAIENEYDSKLLKDSKLSKDCKPCPSNGICKNGKVTCESGYQLVYGECIEDVDVSPYASELADDAYKLLCDLAGRKECGEDTTASLSGNEIREILRAKEIKKSSQRSLFNRRRTYDAYKFDVATSKALNLLSGHDHYNVTHYNINLTEEKEYICNQPTLTFSCALRKTLIKHWRFVLSVVLVLVSFLNLYFKRQRRLTYQNTIREKYLAALECLRNQGIDYRRGEEDHAFITDTELRAELIGGPTRYNLDLWKEVEKLFERDPRIIRVHKTIRGVPSYTYEWVGRRNSGSFVDAGSRRGSFGSRASLDSLDVRSDVSDGEQHMRTNNLVQWWFSRQ